VITEKGNHETLMQLNGQYKEYIMRGS
jgi:hypothetical protein